MSQFEDSTLDQVIPQNQSQKTDSDQNEFQEQITMIQKATFIVENATDQICSQIFKGILTIQDEQKQFPIQRKPSQISRNESLKLKLQQVDIEEHRKKVNSLMQASKKLQKKRSNRALQFQNLLKKSEQQQKRTKQQEKQRQLERRRSLIEGRMASKSQMMSKIRQMSLESNQRFKDVKNKKFLYKQKEQEFKAKFLLPKIEQQKKLLQRRKDKMKSIDINQLLQHEKKYQMKKQTQKINRSMTSRFIKSQTLYNPPEFVPRSYLIYQTQESIKKQQEMLKLKEAQIYKEKAKQFVKNVSEIHKLQKQLSRSRSKSSLSSQKQQKSKKQQKKKKLKKKQLSKQETTNVGNQYFKALLQEIKKVKQKKQKRAKQKQMQLKKLEQQKQLNRDLEEQLEIQIKSEQIRTVQKIQKIEKSYKIRSKKIQTIFNDNSIDPLLKYQKLKHQVQNFDMVLKTKKIESEDIKQRTQAAGCYLNAIKAKLKLLEVTKSK